MQVRVHENICQLREIESPWSRLLTETPRANFFQSLPWLESYWKHFGKDQQLRVLQISHGGETIGIVPWVLKRERTRLGPLNFLTYPLDYWGSFYGPVSRDPAAALAAAISSLDQLPGNWDVLELRWVGADVEECHTAHATLSAHGLSPIVGHLDRTAVVELRGSWESYLAARGSKWRNNLKRWRRRLNDAGKVRYERYRSPGSQSDPRWDLFEACLLVARQSWQGSSRDGTTLTHPEVSQFIRDTHQAAADAGCIDMNLIFLDERPVAFAYNYHFRGQVSGLRVGHDPALKSCGVGNVLYAHAIEDSFARGDWRYDLGPGSLDAKRHLLTAVPRIYRISHFRCRSVRQQLLRWKRQRDATRSFAAEELDACSRETALPEKQERCSLELITGVRSN